MSWSLGDNQRLVVHVPAGTSGEMKVWFAGKPLWRIAEAVSLAAALGLGFLNRRKRRKLQ